MVQNLLEVLCCESFAAPGDLFWRPGEDDVAAKASAFWTHVDDIVCRFDDVQIVFYHNHCVAFVGELVEYGEQNADVFEVEACSRLVEDVKRAPGVALREFSGEFDALVFAT